MVLAVLRKHSGSILVKILMGLLILSFAAWGVSDVLSPKGGDRVVATVGERSIDAVEVERQVESEIRRMRELLGPRFDREQARAFGLHKAVLDRIVREAVLDQAASRLGLVATDAEVRAEIEANPAFKGPLGSFDRNRFQQVLMASGLNEAGYTALLRRSIIVQAMTESALASLPAPKVLAEALYRERGEKRVAETVVVADAAQIVAAAPSDDELVAFHKDNAARFTAPEYRALTVARLDAGDLARDVAVSEEDLKHAYDARAGEFDQPERRTLQQMVLRDEETAKKAAAALARGADFAKTAVEIAKMDAAAVDLGALARDQVPADLAEAVFSLAPNAVSAPLKTPLGWHIVKVVGIEAPRKRALAEVRAQLSQDVARDKALDGLVGLANRFEDALGGGATIEDAAQGVGARVLRVAAIDARGLGPDGKPPAEAGLPPADLLAQVAFATAEKSESPLTEMGEHGYFALRVDKIIPPALKPLADIRAEAIALWRSQKLAEKSKAEAEALAAAVKGGEALKAAAAKRKLAPSETPALGRDGGKTISPAAAQALFALAAPGEVVVARDKDGYRVLRLVSIAPADPAADAEGAATFARDVAQSLGGDLRAALEAALRREMSVKINEANLDRIFR
ncbi:MAG: SurA N-terminal domain-containing protein [Pseudomonadota bacterium]